VTEQKWRTLSTEFPAPDTKLDGKGRLLVEVPDGDRTKWVLEKDGGKAYQDEMKRKQDAETERMELR
jgi:hypothetical protein